MPTCPTGFICLNKEIFAFVIIVAVGLIIFGVTRRSYSEEDQSSGMSDKSMQKLRDTVRETVRESNVAYAPHVLPHAIPQVLPHTIPQVLPHTIPHVLTSELHSEHSVPAPPTRSYPYTTGSAAIHIPTRGEQTSYSQLGVLYRQGNRPVKPDVLPLYGRAMYPGSSKWHYYTSTDNYHSVRVPVFFDGKKCQGGFGCNEISDGDTVTVEPYPGKFRVSLYEMDQPRYLPHVIF